MIFIHALTNTASAMVPYWYSDYGRIIGYVMIFIGIIIIKVIVDKMYGKVK